MNNFRKIIISFICRCWLSIFFQLLYMCTLRTVGNISICACLACVIVSVSQILLSAHESHEDKILHEIVQRVMSKFSTSKETMEIPFTASVVFRPPCRELSCHGSRLHWASNLSTSITGNNRRYIRRLIVRSQTNWRNGYDIRLTMILLQFAPEFGLRSQALLSIPKKFKPGV